MDFGYMQLPDDVKSRAQYLLDVAVSAAKLTGSDVAAITETWKSELAQIYRAGWYDGRIAMNREELERIDQEIARRLGGRG